MTAPAVGTAVLIRPPLSPKVLVATVSASSLAIDITGLEGRFITIQNSGAEDIGWLAGTIDVVADLAALSGDTRCAVLGAGDSDGFAYPLVLTDNNSNLVTHIAVVSGAATTVRIWQS